MKTTDRIMGYNRGTLAQVLDFYSRVKVERREDFEEYVRLVFSFAQMSHMDPSIVIAQGGLETDHFRSYWWKERLNPAGLGITGDPVQNEKSWIFTPETAARAHMSHLMLYATGKIDYPFYTTDDPRAEAYYSAFGKMPKAPSIGQLAGTWAADWRYAEHLVRFGTEIFGDEEQVLHTGPLFHYCGQFKDT